MTELWQVAWYITRGCYCMCKRSFVHCVPIRRLVLLRRYT